MLRPTTSSFEKARRDAHYASQLLAALGETLLARDPQFHYSSTSYAAGWLEGAVLPSGHRGRLELNTLTLDLITDSIVLRGKTMADVVAFVEDQIGEPLRFPGWEMPHGPSSSYGRFDAEADDLSLLSQWFDAARLALETMETSVQGTTTRVWPHHFDMARLYVLRQGATHEDVTSIGVGMTPGDAGIDTPYFYVTPWPYPDARPTPPLPGGRWNVEGWYGAVLEAPQVDSQEQITHFLSSSYTLLADLLTLSSEE